jgi:universal stress protein E
MPRFTNLLVGVDLHHGGRLATDEWGPVTLALIDQAVTVAEATGARITLCGVLEISEQARHLIEEDQRLHEHTVIDVANAALERLVQTVRVRGVAAEHMVRIGRSWEELTRQVLSARHELLLVGTRARGPAKRMLFGSTAQKLIRVCPAPVWVVKPGEVRDIRDIAVATDFSDAAFAALQTAVELVQAMPARLHVLHALEFPFEAYLRTSGVSEEEVAKYRARMEHEAREHMQSHLAQTDARTLKYGVKMELVQGAPDAVVPHYIEENDVDLLVIGTHGRSGLSGLLLGNTAERMLPYVHCSLLAVKPPGFVSPVH